MIFISHDILYLRSAHRTNQYYNEGTSELQNYPVKYQIDCFRKHVLLKRRTFHIYWRWVLWILCIYIRPMSSEPCAILKSARPMKKSCSAEHLTWTPSMIASTQLRTSARLLGNLLSLLESDYTRIEVRIKNDMWPRLEAFTRWGNVLARHKEIDFSLTPSLFQPSAVSFSKYPYS